MERNAIQLLIQQTLDQLTTDVAQWTDFIPSTDKPIPTPSQTEELIGLLREILFPGFFGAVHERTMTAKCQLGVDLDRLYDLLAAAIHRSICFDGFSGSGDMTQHYSAELALQFVAQLPHIKELLATDVKAIFDGDPAAKSYGEVILCYPSVRALLNYRVAHALYKMNVPILPRMITEMAHRETGIDIHPGATIGDYFAIDHGSGVVIGKTTIIGSHVKIYQGVTLGAKSFSVDDEGNLADIPRHPIIGDNVVIYSNASVLGRITIGARSVIGGNVWLTHSVPEDSVIVQHTDAATAPSKA